MFIPWWGLVFLAALYAYLIATDVRLHRRVEKLERTVRRLEGMSEENGHHRRHEEYEHEI